MSFFDIFLSSFIRSFSFRYACTVLIAYFLAEWDSNLWSEQTCAILSDYVTECQVAAREK